MLYYLFAVVGVRQIKFVYFSCFLVAVIIIAYDIGAVRDVAYDAGYQVVILFGINKYI